MFFPGSVEEPAVNMMFSGYMGSWPHVLVCKAFSCPLPLAHAAPRFHLGQCFIGNGSQGMESDTLNSRTFSTNHVQIKAVFSR